MCHVMLSRIDKVKLDDTVMFLKTRLGWWPRDIDNRRELTSRNPFPPFHYRAIRIFTPMPQVSPTKKHIEALKRVFRYPKDTAMALTRPYAGFGPCSGQEHTTRSNRHEVAQFLE
ncbi:hypothetical protein Tco_0216352 [Tanacetum coccineum]